MWGSIIIHFNSISYRVRAKNNHLRLLPDSVAQGFTLIELMVVIAVVAILAAVATPYYSDYVQQGKLSRGMSTLSHLAVQMEKSYLDYRNYGENGACRASAPADEYFTYSCNSNGKTFTWIATAKFGNYKYSINQNGERATLAFSGSTSIAANCWQLSRDGGCY